MPNRILKESIRTSKKVNALSDFDFRVWSYLITYVDDYGRGSADPELLKGIVFPRRKGITESQIQKAIDNLANAGMVILYCVDGEPYLYFPNWSKHQTIRAKKSRFPEPVTCVQMQADSSECSRNPIQSESVSESVSISEIPPRSPQGEKQPRFQPPTLEEVIEYCRERGSSVDPKQFYEYFQAGNWTDSKGQKVKNWKQKLLTWEKYQPPKKQTSGREALEEIYAEAKAAEERGALPEWALPK